MHRLTATDTPMVCYTRTIFPSYAKIIQEVLYKWPYNVCAIWIWKYTKLSLNDRLEVTSPGGLYNGLTYEEVMNGHSKIRNKGIANIFSQMGLVEAWGSGIKRILNAAEEYGL
ncbi:ATP-binding protein [Holdemanella biformis]